MGRVLVTDGSQRSTLAVVRSLGRSGVDVTVAEHRLPCLASVSKYCGSSISLPSPHDNPGGYVDALSSEVDRNKYDLLIPMTDVTVTLVAEHVQRFNPYVQLPFPAQEDLEQALDKERVVCLAEELEIPVPRTWVIDSPKELQALADEFTYPLVLKPRRSKYLMPSGWVSEPVQYAESLAELQSRLAAYDPSIPLPMIQERINGPGCGAFFLFDRGEPRAAFFHRRLREKPPSGGVSVLRESTPPDPELRAHGEKLLTALKWHGVAMVEFKRDLRDGLPKIMEINPRFWGSLQLAIDAGVDFPRLLYVMCSGDKVEPVRDYRTGIKSRWLLGDLDHLSARLRKSSRSLQLPPDAPGRWATLWEFLKVRQSGVRFEVLNRHDIKPFSHELGRYLKDLLRMG